MTKQTDMEFISMLTDPNTQESGMMINSTASALKSGMMAANTQGSTKTLRNMEKESIHGQMETNTLANGT